MLRAALGGALLVVTGADFSAVLAACRTQGPGIRPSLNDKVTYTAIMGRTGCRHFYYSSGNLMFQKAVAMKHPSNGTLTQVGEFSFLYKPKPGFSGKDSYVIYICGSSRAGSGCSRITYEATVE